MATKKPQKQKIDLNVTSLLDVVFQLIIFFLLITNFSSAELPEMLITELDNSKAREFTDEKRVVVNVIANMDNLKSKKEREDPNQTLDAKFVRVGNDNILPSEYAKLTELILTEKAANPEVYVNLRADMRIRYSQVGPVIAAITKAKVSRVNMIATLPKK